MGVTAPSIYTAFGDKKRLFLESVKLYSDPPEAGQQALDQTATARDAAHQMLTSAAIAFTGEATPKGCLLASATASGSTDAQDVQEAVAAIRRDIMARLEVRIGRDIDTGRLPSKTDARALAALVVGVVQGMSVLARDGVGRQVLLAMADSALLGWPDAAGTPR